MKERIHIVAIFARTPVGLNAETTAGAIRAGISRLTEHPLIVDARGDALNCGRDSQMDPLPAAPKRMAKLAEATLREIVAKLPTLRAPSHQLLVSLALPETRPGFTTSHGTEIARTLRDAAAAIGCSVAVSANGAGHAGAIHGMALFLARASEQVCVVGGVESYLDPETIGWLESTKRLSSKETRGGFPPGEAAAMVAFAAEDLVRKWRLPSLAIVEQVACAQEAREEMAPKAYLAKRFQKCSRG